MTARLECRSCQRQTPVGDLAGFGEVRVGAGYPVIAWTCGCGLATVRPVTTGEAVAAADSGLVIDQETQRWLRFLHAAGWEPIPGVPPPTDSPPAWLAVAAVATVTAGAVAVVGGMVRAAWLGLRRRRPRRPGAAGRSALSRRISTR